MPVVNAFSAFSFDLLVFVQHNIKPNFQIVVRYKQKMKELTEIAHFLLWMKGLVIKTIFLLDFSPLKQTIE